MFFFYIFYLLIHYIVKKQYCKIKKSHGQEHRPRVHTGFLIHGKKLLPFLIVEAHHHTVRLAALFRMPPPFRDASSPFFFLFIFIMDLVVRFTAQAQLPARIPQVGNRLPDFGGKPSPARGKVVSGSNRKPFELLKGHLAISGC